MSVYISDHLIVGVTGCGIAVVDAIHDIILFERDGVKIDMNLVNDIAATNSYIIIVTSKYITQLWYDGDVTRYIIPDMSTVDISNPNKAIVTPIIDPSYILLVRDKQHIINFNNYIM